MTTESDPWQELVDDSYWDQLLDEIEDIPPVEEASQQNIEANSWLEPRNLEEMPPPDVLAEDEMIRETKLDSPEHQDGSSARAESQIDNLDADWEHADRLFETKERVHLKVVGYNRGGLLVRLGRIQGFVPASQLHDLPMDQDSQARQAELACWVGCSLYLRVIELDKSRNRLIFSERATLNNFEGEAMLHSLSPGQVKTGMVNSLCGFGAFVDLGGVEGFIHISEFSWGRVNKPSDILEPGQEVQVYVLSVEPAQSRVSLSLKRLNPDPWTLIDERYHVGQMVDGEVTNVVSFGAFVRVEEGMEGLVHISELAEGNFLHPRNVVKEGDMVTARIIRIDSSNHRLGLSLRQIPGGA